MKIITIILTTIFFNACGSSKDLTSKISNENATETSKRVETISKNIEMLEYKVNSRGVHKLIRVNQKNISYRLDRNHELLVLPTAKEDWEELMILLANIDVKGLPNLEAPSKAHHYDGAAQTNFSVYLNDSKLALTTPTFDQGNPNKAIAEIVEKMITLIPSKN
jgi:heat shock protein HslJ